MEDVRSYPPVRAGEFAGSYKTAGGCVAEAVIGQYGINVSYVLREDQKLALLIGAPESQIVAYEARLRETVPGRFHAEVRSSKGFWGDENNAARDVWVAMEKCAAKA